MTKCRKRMFVLFSGVLVASLVAAAFVSLNIKHASAESEAVYTVNEVAGDNLFTDPGFEALTPEGYRINQPWDIYCADQNNSEHNKTIIIKNDAETAHSGNSYLSIGTNGWTGIAQKIHLTPGDYKLSAYAKGLVKDGNNEYNILNFSAFYNEGSDIGYYESDTLGFSVGKAEINETWQQFYRIFRVDVEKDFVVRVGVNGSATVALDDFSLEKLALDQDTEGNELLVNGNFELNSSGQAESGGEPQGWSFYGGTHGRDWANEAGSNKRNNNSYFGKANIYLVMDVGPEFRAIYQEVTVEENTTYKVSAFVRNWGLPESGFMIGMQTEQNGTWTDVSRATIPNDKFSVNHQNVSAYFTTGAGVTKVRIYLGGNAADQGGAGYSLDEVSMKKVSDIGEADIKLSENVTVGFEAHATPIVKYENGNEISDAMYTVSFESSDTEVATIDDSGTINALKCGTTQITLTVKYIKTGTEKTITKEIEIIEPIDIANVELLLDLTEVKAGEKVYPQVIAKTSSNDEISLDDAEIEYTIANVNVAKLNQDGTFFAVGAGKTSITATVIMNGQRVTSEAAVLTVTGNLIRDGGFETNYDGYIYGLNDYWQGEASEGATRDNYGFDIGGFARAGFGNLFVRMPNDNAPTFSGVVRLWQDIQLEKDAYSLGAYIRRFPGEEGSGKFGGDVWFEIVLLDSDNKETSTKYVSKKDSDSGIGQFDAITFNFEIETMGVYRVYIVAQGDPSNNTGIGFQMDDVSLIQGKTPSRISISLGNNKEGDYVLKLNDTAKINVKALYDDGTEAKADKIKLSFSVSDGELVTVSKDGTVFALAVGETAIKVTADVDGVSIVQTFIIIVEDDEDDEDVNSASVTPSEKKGCSGDLYGVGCLAVLLCVGGVMLLKKKTNNHLGEK